MKEKHKFDEELLKDQDEELHMQGIVTVDFFMSIIVLMVIFFKSI